MPITPMDCCESHQVGKFKKWSCGSLREQLEKAKKNRDKRKKICSVCTNSLISGESKTCRPCYGKSMKGIQAPQLVCTEEIRERIARRQLGKGNSNWKGGGGIYGSAHKWMSKMFGPAKEYPCMMCGTKKQVFWANLDNKYTREPRSWTTLCNGCNQKIDRFIKLPAFNYADCAKL